LRQNVRAGELIVPALLVPRAAPPFSEQVEPGRRAVTVPVDEVSAFDGLLSPGDHVDLLYAQQSFEGPGPRPTGPAVKVLLETVPVLATGRATRRTLVQAPDGTSQAVDSSFSTATLSVTPAEAQLITLAQRTGELVATLRHPHDSAASVLAPLHASALDGRLPSRPVRAMPRLAMELITGGRGGIPNVQRVAVAAPLNP
jgi:pilus assembly protein CpaB